MPTSIMCALRFGGQYGVATLEFDDVQLYALAAALANVRPPGTGTGTPGPTPPAPGPAPGPAPVPPAVPSPTDPLARWKSAPSDWARWTSANWISGGGYTPQEFPLIQQYLMHRYGWDADSAFLRINQQIQPYEQNVHLRGRRLSTGAYQYYNFSVQAWVDDTNGAADTFIRTVLHQNITPLSP